MQPQIAVMGLVLEVNDLLARYIAVHNAVIARRFSLREFLPIPFLFRRTPYAALHAEAEIVVAELADRQSQLGSLQRQVADPPEVVALIQCLAEYVATLRQTAAHLTEVSDALRRKSSGERVSWSEYRQRVARYEASVPAYCEIGARLNEAVAKARSCEFV